MMKRAPLRIRLTHVACIPVILLSLLLIPEHSLADIPLNSIGSDVTGVGGLATAWSFACTYLPYCTGSATGFSGLELLGAIIGNAVLWVIGGVAVCVVIYGAILIIASPVKTENIESGKKAVLYGLLGLLIALIANEVVDWICYLLFVMGGTGPFC